MVTNRFRRVATMLSASALALGVISTGVTLSTSGAGAAASTPGVTAKTITIGATVPLSGIAASYAEVSATAAAVFKYVNSKGGVNGRTINYIRKDDCYNIAALGCTANVGNTPTYTQTVSLVTQSHVLAEVGSLGTAAQDSVLKYLNQNGVPDLFVSSGSSDWNHPSTYKLLFGYQPSYQAESKIFAHWIQINKPNATIGAIGQADDFGANGLAGLIAGAANISSSNEFTYNPFSPTIATDLAQALGTLKAHGVSVVVLDSIPAITTAILQVAYHLSYNPQWVISSVGSDPISVATPLEAGAVTLDYFAPTTDNSNIWNVWLKKVIAADPSAHTDFPNYFSGANAGILDANMQYGAGYAVAFVEALKSLGKNVTRAGLVKAMTTTNFATPSIVPLHYSATQHQGLQGGALATVTPNSNPTSAPQGVTLIGNRAYTTGDTAATNIAESNQVISPIPSWLK